MRASRARMAIVELKRAQDARDARVTYSEETLAGTEPWRGTHALGADSEKVDRRLIGKAKALLESGAYDAVLLASNDYGIALDIEELRAETHLPIFFISDPHNTDEPLKVLWHHLAFGRSDGPWRAECVLEMPTPVMPGKVFVAPEGEVATSVDSDERTVRVWRLFEEPDLMARFGYAAGETTTIPVQGSAVRCRYTMQRSLVVVTGALEQQTATEYAFGFHNTPDGDRTATPGPSITGRCFAFSPDGRFIAAAQEHTVEGRLERNLSLYDLTLGKPFALLPHTAPMGIRTHAMAFSPDSRLLAAAGQQLFNMPGRGVVGAITIHDISSGQQIATLIPQDKKSGLEYAVSAIAFSPTGAFLAAGTFYGDVHVWSVSTLAPVKTHKVRGTVRSLAFSPDGGLLACGAGDTVSLLRAPSFAEVTIVAPSIRRFRDGPPSEVLSLGFVPNGTRLWSLWGHIRDGLESGRSRVVLWTVPEGRHLVTFSHERARWLDIDGNGEFVVTADQDSVLRVWRLNGQLNRAVLLQRSL